MDNFGELVELEMLALLDCYLGLVGHKQTMIIAIILFGNCLDVDA